MVLNRNLLFQGFIFRFHVTFRGCKSKVLRMFPPHDVSGSHLKKVTQAGGYRALGQPATFSVEILDGGGKYHNNLKMTPDCKVSGVSVVCQFAN